MKHLTLFSALTLTFALFLVGCGNHRIRSNGLKFAKLGQDMPADSLNQLAGYPMNHFVEKEGDFEWRVCELEVPEGKVIVESDFLDNSLINRIRIESPGFEWKKGITIGKPAQELARASDSWEILPFPKYKYLEARSPDFPNTIFLISSPGHNYEINTEVTIPLQKLSQNAVLAKIVVM